MDYCELYTSTKLGRIFLSGNNRLIKNGSEQLQVPLAPEHNKLCKYKDIRTLITLQNTTIILDGLDFPALEQAL